MKGLFAAYQDEVSGEWGWFAWEALPEPLFFPH